MGFQIKGLDEMNRKLETLQRRAQNLNGPVPFDDLFPPEFMRRYTKFKTIDEMLGAFGTPIDSTEDFERIPSGDWDVHVREMTTFQTWSDMQTKAGEEFVERRLNPETL